MSWRAEDGVDDRFIGALAAINLALHNKMIGYENAMTLMSGFLKLHNIPVNSENLSKILNESNIKDYVTEYVLTNK